MIKETQTVWLATNGDELLRKKGEDKYYTPLGTMTLETLRELSEACNDAAYDAKKKEAK